MSETKRNYRIVALHPNRAERCYQVVIEGDGRVRNTGHTAAEWGDFGLTRAERGILRRGLTDAGYDRCPPEQPTVLYTCAEELCGDTAEAPTATHPQCPTCYGPMTETA